MISAIFKTLMISTYQRNVTKYFLKIENYSCIEIVEVFRKIRECVSPLLSSGTVDADSTKISVIKFSNKNLSSS